MISVEEAEDPFVVGGGVTGEDNGADVVKEDPLFSIVSIPKT